MDAAESMGFVHHGTPVVCKPSFKVLYSMAVAWVPACADLHAGHSHLSMFIGNRVGSRAGRRCISRNHHFP